MPIFEFCDSFGLQPSVLEKLEENAYDYAQNLCFITLNNLTEMGFKLGQRAALQDAVEHWSVMLCKYFSSFHDTKFHVIKTQGMYVFL